MKTNGRWLVVLSMALPISACIVLLLVQRREIEHLAGQNDWLRKDRSMLEKRLEITERIVEQATGKRADLLDEESEPVTAEAGETPETAKDGKETTTDGPDRLDLAVEVENLRKELDAYRSLPGDTEALLAIAKDPEKNTKDRQAALFKLLQQCDIGAHMNEILDAFTDEADPELHRNFAGILAELGVKFHSPEMVDAVMADIREGNGNTNSAASMLARFHGPAGVEKIGTYLADGNEYVRRAAIQAVGQQLPKSDPVISTLRAAEMNLDPGVRGRAAFYLANHDEPYTYEGMIDDWRAMTFSMAAEDFGSISTPAEKIFGGLSPGEVASFMKLIADLGQSHPDENIRKFMASAIVQLRQKGLGK